MATGGRFVSIFRPVAQLHEHGAYDADDDARDAFLRFRRAVVAQRPPTLESYDLSLVFDRHFAHVAVLDNNSDITEETIFVDSVHLGDLGNRIVAEHLIELLNVAHDSAALRSGTHRP